MTLRSVTCHVRSLSDIDSAVTCHVRSLSDIDSAQFSSEQDGGLTASE